VQLFDDCVKKDGRPQMKVKSKVKAQIADKSKVKT